MPKETLADISSENPPVTLRALMPDLARFLGSHEYACVTQTTDAGAAYVCKVRDWDIDSLRGEIPIWVRYQLYEHPSAPVIRTVVRLYDRPRTPLCLESFINIADDVQRAEFASLAAQERLLFLFYDEQVALRLKKSVRHSEGQRQGASELLQAASDYLATMSNAQFDFDKAKAAVMAATDI
jgi:hypothetical protein